MSIIWSDDKEDAPIRPWVLWVEDTIGWVLIGVIVVSVMVLGRAIH